MEITEEYLRSIDIHSVLPQQEAFVMVGVLTSFDEHASTTQTLITSTNILLDKDGFSEAGMMENIAQTCAARIGFYNKYILHKQVQVGVIGAVRDYVVYGKPQVGDLIETRVDILEEIFGMTMAKAQITCQNKLMAEAQIKLSVRNVE